MTNSGGSGQGGAGGTGSGGEGTGGTIEGPPQWLSETGLYAEDMETLAEGVEPFEPRFELWSDGATKRRWVALPEGSAIDTSDMDFWSYPPGTRLWKEFTRDGVRVETRLIERQPNGSWWMMAYQWNEEGTDAEARPDGVIDASGTGHDIPSQSQCESCHGQMPDRALGFSALQLAHDGPGVTLQSLMDRGALSDPPTQSLDLPGNDSDVAVLGYLHANCGNCHNAQSSVSLRVNMRLWLSSDQLESVEQTTVYATTVGVEVQLPPHEGPPGADLRIAPGDPDHSALYLRIGSREEFAMPPLGTELVHAEAQELLREWITNLAP